MERDSMVTARSTSNSFADFYLTSAYSQFPQEHRIDGGGSGIRAFVVDQQAHDFTDIATSDWVLGLPLKATCPTRFDFGDGWRRCQRRRGDFLLVPPRTEVRYEIGGPTRLLILTWAEGRLKALDEKVFTNEVASLQDLTGRYFKSTAIETMCRTIWTEMARDDEPSRLLLEGLLAQLAGSLARSAHQQVHVSPHRRSEVRRAVSYIEDNLQGDISLGELAQVAGLSVFHFAREFQTQVGDAPYRFVQKRRATKAAELLSQTKFSAEDVAKRAGFGSVRSMRNTLRRYPLYRPGA